MQIDKGVLCNSGEFIFTMCQRVNHQWKFILDCWFVQILQNNKQSRLVIKVRVVINQDTINVQLAVVKIGVRGGRSGRGNRNKNDNSSNWVGDGVVYWVHVQVICH